MRTSLLALIAVALLPLPAATPAEAASVPAYGTIRIANDGAGLTPTWTYDPVTWRCQTEVDGLYHAPSAVTVTCRYVMEDGGSPFFCPLMVLTDRTSGATARAGGRATCTTSIDTGVISGVDTATRQGHLGHAYTITCTAYVGSLTLVPPYEVTCSEPGLPG